MKALIYTIIILLSLSILIGCKSRAPQYVPIESSTLSEEKESKQTKDSIHIIEKTNIKDSVRIKDSIVYKVMRKAM